MTVVATPGEEMSQIAQKSDLNALKHEAEAPAATGDFAGSLLRWRKLAETASHPSALVYVARYLALTGEIEAAVAIAETVVAEGSLESLLSATTKFYLEPLRSQWLRAVDALTVRTRPNGAWSASLDRLYRASFLFDLDIAHRMVAIGLFDRLAGREADGFQPDGRQRIAVAAFIAIHAPENVARRLLDVLAVTPGEHGSLARLAIRERMAGRADAAGVVNLAAVLGSRDAIVPIAAYFEEHDQAHLQRLIHALPDHGWSTRQIRSTHAALVKSAEPWCSEVLLTRMVGDSDGEVATQLARAELAALAGDGALALARQILATRKTMSAAVAGTIAERLLSQGFRNEAALLMEPHVAESEKAAFIHASALWRTAPDRRTAAPWVAGAMVHKSARLIRGLAAALAEELAYDEAIGLIESVIPMANDDPLAWRDLALLYERIGDHRAWKKLITRLESRFPGDLFLAGEQLKHALETATPVNPDAPPGIVGEIVPDVHLGRAAARHLVMQGRSVDASTLWAEIVSRTNSPNDHYQHVLARCQEGAFAEAAEHLRDLIKRLPGDYRLHLKLAQLQERRCDYAGALDSFTAALRVEPENPDSLAGVARCLTYLGRYQSCDDWLDLFPGNDIGRSWSLAARAFNAVRKGHPDAARQALGGLQHLVSRFRAAREQEIADNPEMVWISGHLRQQPRSSFARHSKRFSSHLRWLEHGERIVLVGNSPNLLGTGKGPAIDAFDRVIRLNDFSITGFEADVGSRTDLWYTSANRLARPNIDADPATRVWLSQPYPQHFPDLESFTRGRLGMDLNEEVTSFLPPWVHTTSAQLIYPRPSSGLRMIGILDFFLAHPYTITGFSFFDDATIHYFDDEPGRLQIGEVHAIDFERDFVKEVLPLTERMSWL